MAAQMKWDEIITSTLTAYFNHGLTALFLYLGQLGLRADSVLTPENIGILAAALVTAGLSLGMRLYRQKATHNLVEAARQAAPGTLFADIKADANAKPIIG